MIQVVWFKRDLRTSDHRPLWEAARAGPVLPLYIVEPDYWAGEDVSARQWRATADALDELDARLARLGAPLQLRMGDAVAILARLHAEHRLGALHAHEETGNLWTFERDKAVRRFCRRNVIPFHEYRQLGVFRGPLDRDRWSARHAEFLAEPEWPEPARLTPALAEAGEPCPDAAALGRDPDGCAAPQSGARSAGMALMRSFLDGRGADYRRAMSSPEAGARACSRLSVPLATGAISLREIFRACAAARAEFAQRPPAARPVPLTAIDSLVSRLHWRSHFAQKLETDPAFEIRSMHPLHEARRRPTAPDDPVLLAWGEGRTGLPFLDACLRSLIATGWLNFRMRAMVQAFACHQLGLDWRASGLRLARLFTDYEPGVHWPQAQMQAGHTGINIPRIYNPVKQGFDQDPSGAFTRRWVPELARVPSAWLQEPWRMDADDQRASGCRIGADYPRVIVDPTEAYRAARARLTETRREAGYREAAAEVNRRHGSRKRSAARPDRRSRADAQLSFEF